MNSDSIRQMFDAISPRYDLMNTLISLGLHHRWRKNAVKWGDAQPGMQILDLCTGTGDFAFAAAEVILQKIEREKIPPAPSTTIIGLDFSENMLQIAEQKMRKRELPFPLLQMKFTKGDVLNMPFGGESFHLVTIGFGLRNLENLPQGLAEIHRILKPDGILLALEAGYPENPLFLPLFHLYFRGIVPILGWLIARNLQAYTYLPLSARSFPSREEMARAMNQAGFRQVHYRQFAFGSALLYKAHK